MYGMADTIIAIATQRNNLLKAMKKIDKICKGCKKRKIGYDPKLHEIAIKAIAKVEE